MAFRFKVTLKHCQNRTKVKKAGMKKQSSFIRGITA